MVGDILQDQEAKDREQFVFRTHEDASMDTVADQLDDLTKHIQKLSMGEGQDEAVGPRMMDLSSFA